MSLINKVIKLTDFYHEFFFENYRTFKLSFIHILLLNFENL